MAKPFDFFDLEVSEAKVNEIAESYATKVVVKDYYTKQILFDSSLNVHFVRFLKAYLQSGEIEKGEYWVKEDLGKDNGWQHMCQKLYKKHSKYENQLHIVVHLYIKKKGLFFTDKRKKYPLWKQFVWGMLGLDFVDRAFPSQKGNHNLFGSLFVSMAMAKYFNSENKKAEDNDYKFDEV